jgi:hypothetical protein
MPFNFYQNPIENGLNNFYCKTITVKFKYI